MRKAHVFTTLIVLLPILALALASYLYLRGVSRDLAARLPKLISAAASERINGDLRIGKVEVHTFGVALRDVTLTESAKLGGKRVLAVPEARISCKLWDIVIRGADPAKSIRSIDVLDPTVFLERLPDGRWNISRLIKKIPAGKPLEFDGEVRVSSARVSIRDRRPNPSKPTANLLSDVSALIDFSKPKVAKFTAWGNGPRGLIEQFTIRGQYDLVRRGYVADADILSLNARYFSTYPWRVGLNVLSGRADARVRLSKPLQKGRLDYTAAISIRDAAVGFRGIRQPIKQVAGDVSIRKGVVSLALDGGLGSSPFSVSGEIRDLKHARLDLALASDRANVREAMDLAGYARDIRGIGLSRTGRVRALITGAPRSPVVDFELSLPSLSCAGFSGTNLQARGTYRDRRIDLRNATLSACGGRIEGAGTIDLSRKPSADIYGRATRIALDKIPVAARYKLGIISSGRFHASVRKGDFGLAYRGAIGGFKSGGVRFEDGLCDLAYERGGLVIRELSAHTLGGVVAASGKVSRTGELRLKTSGADINLAKVASAPKKLPAVGRAHFAGEVTGTLKSPVFKGEIGAYRMMVSGVEVQRVAGKVTASREKVVLDALTAHFGEGTLSVSGHVLMPFARKPMLNLVVKADSLDIAGFALDYLPEGGRLSGEILIAGDLRDPSAQGNVSAEGGSWRDINVDALEAHATYSSGTVTIHSLSAISGDSSIIAEGDVSADRRINVAVRSEGFALEKLSNLFQPYVVASGKAAVSGSVTGTLDAPLAEVTFESDGPTVNARKFNRLSTRLTWREGDFSVEDFVLADANSEYSVPKMTFDPDSRELAFESKARNASAGKLLAMIEGSPALKEDSPQAKKLASFVSRIARPFSGTLNGEVSGSILFGKTEATPNLATDITVSGMKLGLNTFDSVHIRGSWNKDAIKLDALDAREGEMALSASGRVGPNDVLDLQAQGRDLDVATLRGWLGFSHNFSGKADVTIVASGTKRAPTSDIDIKISNPTIGGTRFDSLKSHLILTGATGVASTEQGAPEARVNISELTLSLGDRSLRVYGYVPLDLDDYAVPSNARLLIQSDLDADSLAILSKFSGIAMQTGASGSLAGSVKLAGTIESPKLEGSLAWTDGQVQIPRLNSPLTGITARLSLVGDKVSIQELAGRSSEGGSFVVSGSVSLADLKPSLDLEVLASELRVSGRNISNLYGEDVRLKLDGKVKITGDAHTPLVAGALDVPEGSVALPNKPAKKTYQAWAGALDPTFDIKANLGSGVRFGAARFKSPMIGTVAIAGTLTKPSVEGRLNVSGGTIIFPMRRFKMLPGSSIVLQTGSKGIGMQVDVTAQTRMSAYSEIGRRRMYSITMVAQGPLDKLTPDFSSSPPDLSEQRIVGLLAGQGEFETLFARNGDASFGKSISSIFSTALMPSVFEPIEESFESMGFEEFGLDVGYGEPVQLTIGRRLFGGVHLDYSAAFGARPDYSDSMRQLRLYYRFKRGLEVGVTTDENNTVTLGVEGTLRY